MPTMIVKELQKILDRCDPNGRVDLVLPEFIADTDAQVDCSREAVIGQQAACDPAVSVCFSGKLVNAGGGVGLGVKPDRVTIAVPEDEVRRLLNERLRRIEADAPASNDAECPDSDDAAVVVDVRIPRQLHSTIRRMLRAVNGTREVQADHTCSHGPLTVAGLLEMLAEDVGKVSTRPGSWEGANMREVLAGHGYNAPYL